MPLDKQNDFLKQIPIKKVGSALKYLGLPSFVGRLKKFVETNSLF